MAQIAVIETGSKQYIVKPGDVIRIEKLEAKEGEKLNFEPLLVADEDDKGRYTDCGWCLGQRGGPR